MRKKIPLGKRGTRQRQQAVLIKSGTGIEHIALRREILDWRDRHLLEIDQYLNREVLHLISDVNAKMDDMQLPDLLRGGKKFMQSNVAPIFASFVERHSKKLIEGAQIDLREIQDHILSVQRASGELASEDSYQAMYADIALAGALAAGSVAAGAGTTAAAITSAGGILGLLGLTTISFPVVAIGVIVAAAAIGIAGSKVAKLRQKQVERRKVAVAAQMRHLILGMSNQESLCMQLQKQIEATANEVLTRLPS